VNSGCDPLVSVIVPARNEEACLGLCLESLVAQSGINFEIIVVDDASTDRTAEIARSFEVGGALFERARKIGKGTTSSRAEQQASTANGTADGRALSVTDTQTSESCLELRIIPAGPLPEYWTGKNNAMSAGAKITHAKAKWLLFTDADTVHKPGSLARAVAEAEQHGAALLSYSPEQEVRTFWEKAVMPVIFAELAATYPPKKVNDPTSPIAAANGQYLMISREAYDAVGGHTKIAGDLLEDVAMARLVKSAGRKIVFRYGGDAVRTRMYRNWAHMKERWTKNLALLFRRLLWKAWNVSFYYWMTLGGLAFMFTATVLHDKTPLVGLIIMLYPLSAFLRMRAAHFSVLTSSIAVLFGPPVVVYLLLHSSSRNKAGRVTWKDRQYLPSPLR
jgi:glycosyltransferase involved in cell wall biosynthesis